MCDYKCATSQCTYYNYPSYVNSKACIPIENYSTYKLYSGIGYKEIIIPILRINSFYIIRFLKKMIKNLYHFQSNTKNGTTRKTI